MEEERHLRVRRKDNSKSHGGAELTRGRMAVCSGGFVERQRKAEHKKRMELSFRVSQRFKCQHLDAMQPRNTPIICMERILIP